MHFNCGRGRWKRRRGRWLGRRQRRGRRLRRLKRDEVMGIREYIGAISSMDRPGLNEERGRSFILSKSTIRRILVSAFGGPGHYGSMSDNDWESTTQTYGGQASLATSIIPAHCTRIIRGCMGEKAFTMIIVGIRTRHREVDGQSQQNATSNSATFCQRQEQHGAMMQIIRQTP